MAVIDLTQIGFVARGHACDLQMAHTTTGQITAQLRFQIALHDLTMVEVHLHFEVGGIQLLNPLMRLGLFGQKIPWHVSLVEGLNEHVHGVGSGFFGGPLQVG